MKNYKLHKHLLEKYNLNLIDSELKEISNIVFEELLEKIPNREGINNKYPINKNETYKTILNVGGRIGANYILNEIEKKYNLYNK